MKNLNSFSLLRQTVFFFALFLFSVSFAQLEPPKPKPILGARSLALSPDGTRLAFAYRGDIWICSSKGGVATPITTNEARDDFPNWSPDGQWIAYASTRTGNYDIYLAPVNGGATRRLTWYDGYDLPSDWTADGKYLIVRGQRDEPNQTIYKIDVETGQMQRLFSDMMPLGSPRLLPGDSEMVYLRFGFPYFRARYHGSMGSQIWTYNLETGKNKVVRANGFQHIFPTLSTDGRKVFCITVDEVTPSTVPLGQTVGPIVDNVRRTPNVYEVGLDGRSRRLTNFIGSSMRSLTSARNKDLLAFERKGTVYTLVPGQTPQELEIYTSIDDRIAQEEHKVLTKGSEGSVLSPKMDKVAFKAEDDIWMVPVKKGKGPNANDAVQLTKWAGSDHGPLWHPDNEALFFISDRDGYDNIYKVNTATRKVERFLDTGADTLSLRLSPDQKKLIFLRSGTKGGIYEVPLEGGEPTLLLDRPSSYLNPYLTDFALSPDGRYLAYVDHLNNSGFYHWEYKFNIFIKDFESGAVHNVTRLSAMHIKPQFSPDGKYLFFVSDRDGGGVYSVALQEEGARATELELVYEAPKEPVKVDIDFEDIDQRIRKVIPQSSLLAGRVHSWDDGNIRVNAQNGDLYFLVNGDLWRSKYDGEDFRALTKDAKIQGFEFSADGNQIVFDKDQTIGLMNIRIPPTPITTVDFRADLTRNMNEVRRAAFNQYWGVYNRAFYDPNFHGRDWEAIRKDYEPLLDFVASDSELALLLNWMTGELECSHAEVSSMEGHGGSQSAFPGFLFDYTYKGPGIRVKEVPANAPGSYTNTRIGAGEYVLAINGKDVRLDEALWRDVLNNQVGRDITLLVNKKPSKEGAREVTYRAFSERDWSQLLENNRIQRMREYVDKKSGGRIAYVYIASMSQDDFRRFNQEFWENVNGKEAAIIDVRFNGGGNISDRLIDMLDRVPYGYYKPRNGETMPAPGQSWNRPTVVLHNERSASNAEMFPNAMKERRLGTLVGMPTPGYVIWTQGFRLVNGVMARLPNSGVYRADGSPMENNGEQPDIKVDITPEEYFSGNDPQLDKALEILLGKL